MLPSPGKRWTLVLKTFRVNKQLLNTDHPLKGDGENFLSRSKIARG